MEGSDSPESSCVSMKSDCSMNNPLTLAKETASDIRAQTQSSKPSVDNIFKVCEEKLFTLLQRELNSFKNLLTSSCPETKLDDEKKEWSVREGVLKLLVHVLKDMNETELANTLQNKFITVKQEKLKSKFLMRYRRINEGISDQGGSILLNEIYTDLNITEGCEKNISEEEIKQIKNFDFFQEKSIRTVLTKGVDGIGKTFSVQKFILDWAEGKANQDFSFVFPLPFRELNLIKQHFSLMSLIHHFFPEIKKLQKIDPDFHKIIFIFDGLDECQLFLDFQNVERLCDITKPASVDVLLMNLIKGNMLPSAHLWITTRPVAASQIPPELVDQVTEVRGFSDSQKEEYFRKKIINQRLAGEVISHIKKTRSLHTMCHIPVFCWISATVLERLLGEAAEGGSVPKTLTQMFIHFIIYQIKFKNQKYHQESMPKQIEESILALGKLAFQQLDNKNQFFFKEDLCGVNASVYSGICTEIVCVDIGWRKVFSFLHTSIQEFLAALYTFLSFIKVIPVKDHTTGLSNLLKNSDMSEFQKSAVDQALQSETGHLDLFLRFLLGLSLNSNQILLQSVLPQIESRSYNNYETVEYIKEKINENPSPERTINLFHCLNELGDQSLVQGVQEYLKKDCQGRVSLSPAQWSALAFVMLNSVEELEEFVLRKYDPSEECLLRLLPVIKASRKAQLKFCNLSEKSCEVLSSVISSNNSSLRELVLSNNAVNDSGVKKLSVGLKHPQCKLEILSLCYCELTEESCEILSAALSLNSSSLRELDLSDNEDLKDSGVMRLAVGLQSPHCKLEKLELCNCSLSENSCESLSSVLSSESSRLKKLHLNDNKDLKDSGVIKLCAALKDPHCKLELLSLSWCSITNEGCSALYSALSSNPKSHLTELDLSRNNNKSAELQDLCHQLKMLQIKM